MDICIAASISLVDSRAVELAAATTVATVPNFAEPVPLREFTASLWAFKTNCVALMFGEENDPRKWGKKREAKKPYKKKITKKLLQYKQ